MFEDLFGFRIVRREDEAQAQQASSGADGVTNNGRTVHLYGTEALTVSAVYRAPTTTRTPSPSGRAW